MRLGGAVSPSPRGAQKHAGAADAHHSSHCHAQRALPAHERRAHTAAGGPSRAQAEEDTKGFAKIICTGRKNEIVGAHIVGPHAGELIHEVVLAMKLRLSITALGSMIHVYPTLTQINQQAGLDAITKNISNYNLKRRQ